MKKINHFILFAGFCLLSLLTLAQDVKWEKQIMFSLPTKNVEAISYNNDDIYIRTVDSLYIISKNGEIKVKNSSTDKYLIFEGKNSYSLENNIISDESHKTIIDLSEKLDKEGKITKYLAKTGDSFYTCVLDSTNISYSSNIAKVIYGNQISMFCYIVGIPAGLYCYGDSLYYLYNKSVKNKNGMLRIYNFKSGDLISENEIPVINPIGIYVINDQLYTYSNLSGEFIQLTKGGK